ncbi:MAG: restriction endonuclease subunit S, partial [Endomicrobiia bacterium]
ENEILYLHFFLQQEKVRNYLKEHMEGTTKRRRLKVDTIMKFLLPLPPLQEQKEIAEILQTVDKKIEIEKKKKELYEELFKTMLNKIMNGEVDVEKIVIP